MDTVISNFVQVLRGHCLRVSSAESLDALNALHRVDLGEREVVRIVDQFAGVAEELVKSRA